MTRRDFGFGLFAALAVGVAPTASALSRRGPDRPHEVISKRVSRKTVDAASREITQARGVQVDRGEVRGTRLLGMRPDSVLRRLGLKNGDIMISVNGKSTPAKEASEILRKSLREEDFLNVVLYRKDRWVLLRVEVEVV